jgi:protein-L-isoaspartate(D-aspartate) O-methyltransferase
MLDDFRHKGLRKKMVDYLKLNRGISNSFVLSALLKVPRHIFLDSSFLEFAYDDKPFPIGSGQTISSLYTVAFQTQLLNVQRKDKILEIGTGSGYQTAVLAEMGATTYSIERHRALHKKAKKTLLSLHYRANLVYGDGYLGLDSQAPFDKILVTCGASEVPPLLIQQLKLGGEMVIPVGFKEQIMTHIHKDLEGNIVKNEHEKCQFVPLLRDRE